MSEYESQMQSEIDSLRSENDKLIGFLREAREHIFDLRNIVEIFEHDLKYESEYSFYMGQRLLSQRLSKWLYENARSNHDAFLNGEPLGADGNSVNAYDVALAQQTAYYASEYGILLNIGFGNHMKDRWEEYGLE